MEQKSPIVICDCDNPSTILCVIMVPDSYGTSIVMDVIDSIKDKFPGEWSMVDILLEFTQIYPEFEIYDCKDISRMEV
jgi:hypothetical protein